MTTQPGSRAAEQNRESELDPLVRASFLEACLVTAIWFAAGVWSIAVCATMGYSRPASELTLILGFPDWVFWGIVVPWLTCTAVSCVFGWRLAGDGDLGVELQSDDDLGLGG
jgi:hypothetical protein